MMDYLETIAEIHSNKKMEMSEFDIQTKSYTSLALLIYNLDETSQKS
jgi:hypothetical protein